MITLELSGTKEVIRDLEDFKDVSADAIMRAFAKLGLKIQSAAKLRLKERRHYITGRLASSIHSEVKQGVLNDTNTEVTGNTYQYEAEVTKDSFDGSLNEQIGNLELIVGTNVEYAQWVENGHHSWPGDPFMRFAAELGDKDLDKYVREQVDKAVDEANNNKSNYKKPKKAAQKGDFKDGEYYG